MFHQKQGKLYIFDDYFKHFRYLSRLQETGILSEDNKIKNSSNQTHYRNIICLCPLIKELEKNTHSESCLTLNKCPPQADAYRDPICGHLKTHRPLPKPINDFQWFRQVIIIYSLYF